MFSIAFAPPALPEGGALVLPVAREGKLGREGAALDKKLDGALRRAMTETGFTGAAEKTLALRGTGAKGLSCVVLVGVDDPAARDAKGWERVGGAALGALLATRAPEATFLLDAFDGEGRGAKALAPADRAAHAALGARLGGYRFDSYRTTLKAEDKPRLKNLVVATAEDSAARALWTALDKLADSVCLTRDLVSEPPNVLYPETLAARCAELKSLGLGVEILDDKKLRKLGMGALLGVAQGSVRPARVVVLSWKGDPGARDKRPIAFVGKGVTFDTGGISLKPPAGMEKMKYDMAGAAAVIGALRALAARKARANVVGIVGLVENMPSGAAMRPGDIVRSLSGQTIEVLNTDAEGRLVLADILWHVQEKYAPRCVVDLATLTGAISVALGNEFAGLFTNDDTLSGQLVQAGKDVDEPLWRMPLTEAYNRDMDSTVADMKNSADKGHAGSATAACFLQRFIKKDTPWAHLDIAGMAWTDKDKPLCPKGATAFGVRLLERFVTNTLPPAAPKAGKK